MKLESYGVTGRVVEWIRSFLMTRKLRVTVGESVSGWSEVLSPTGLSPGTCVVCVLHK